MASIWIALKSPTMDCVFYACIINQWFEYITQTAIICRLKKKTK